MGEKVVRTTASPARALLSRKPATKPTIARPPVANSSLLAKVDEPGRITTDEGHSFPAPFVLGWAEPFEVTLGAHKTGYGDVKLRLQLRYLGRHQLKWPEDQVIVRDFFPDPENVVLGKLQNRALNVRILDYDSSSLLLDLYGDGTSTLWITDEVEDTPEGHNHSIRFEQNAGFWAGSNLIQLRTRSPGAEPPSGGPGTLIGVERPIAIADERSSAALAELPTTLLLRQARDRLQKLKLFPLKLWGLSMRLEMDLRAPTSLADDLPRSTLAGDDPGLRKRALRLLEVLSYVGPVFTRLEAMTKPDHYLPELADDAIAEVHRIATLYADALVASYGAGYDPKKLAEADKAFDGFYDWLTLRYLRDPKGVRSIIGKIAELELEYREWFEINNGWASRTPGYRTRVEERVKVLDRFWGKTPLASEHREQRARLEQAFREEEKNVLERIHSFYADIQVDVGILTALVVREQLVYLARELGSLTNQALEVVLADREDLAWQDVRNLEDIIEIFEAAEYEKDGEARRAKVRTALDELARFLEGVQGHIEAYQSRIKWVNRINIAAKMILILAVAALTSGTAGSVAFAGLRAAGAGVGYATAGELVLEGLVFTATSRFGQELLIGPVEGSFMSEWFWNTVTLGMMKVVNAGFSKIFKLPKNASRSMKLRHELGRTATAMIALHGFGELHHRIAEGEWMSGDQRADAIFQNVAVTLGLEAGRFITQPLTKRFSEKLLSALKIDKALAAKLKQIELQREPLKKQLEELARGELPPEQVTKLYAEIEALWAAELKLLEGLAKRGVYRGEFKMTLGHYKAHVARMELQLARLGIEAPSVGEQTFRPLAQGIVAFKPEGRALLEQLYNPADPAAPGKSLTESKTMPGTLEGRMPDGQLTYYVPEGMFPPGVQSARDIVAARDAATLAVKSDPIAAKGLEALKARAAQGDAVTARDIDVMLARVAPEHVPAYLRVMADVTLPANLPHDFFVGLAGRPRMIELARAYGGELVAKLYEQFGWSARGEQALEVARTKLERAPTPEARDALLQALRTADRATFDALLTDARTLARQAVEETWKPAHAGDKPPEIEVVPPERLGSTARSARVVIEAGKVTRILVDETASLAAIREELRHAMQAADPRFRHLFEKLDPGRPYEELTPREKLEAHLARVELEIADKKQYIEQLRNETGPLASDEIIRAYEDINNLRALQLELAKLRARDLTPERLSPLLEEPAHLHAKKTKSSLVVSSAWAHGTLGEFREMLEASNPTHHLTAREVEDLYNRERIAANLDRIPAEIKFDALAKLGPTLELPLTTKGKRQDTELLISAEERARLDKLTRARDEARRRRNEAQAANDLASAKRWDQKMREASHQLGEKALDIWAKQRAWKDNARPSLFYRAAASRAGDFDAIHRWMAPDGTVVYLVGEGKGAGATLGGKWLKDQPRYVQQGSREYFEAIAEEMVAGRDPKAQVAGKTLLEILLTGRDLDGHRAKILYEKVQVPVESVSARTLSGQRGVVSRFEITPFLF